MVVRCKNSLRKSRIDAHSLLDCLDMINDYCNDKIFEWARTWKHIRFEKRQSWRSGVRAKFVKQFDPQIKWQFQRKSVTKEEREEGLRLGLHSLSTPVSLVDEDVKTEQTTDIKKLLRYHFEDILPLQ